VVHDRRTAKALGSESTGHAVPGGGAFGALPANLVLDAGTATPRELVASIGRGLLVTDFWYTRVLDPRTIVVTGLTRNGVWLVEDGRFTQSFVDALGPAAVKGVGSDQTLVGGATFGFGADVVPSLHLAAWNFTGGAKG
jgi:predicted Zn-dependent protease